MVNRASRARARRPAAWRVIYNRFRYLPECRDGLKAWRRFRSELGARGNHRADRRVVVKGWLLMKQLMVAGFMLAGNQLEWNRYHDRQAACADAERLARQCERGVDYCDELA